MEAKSAIGQVVGSLLVVRVSRMSSSQGDAAIIKAIVSLGQGFGLGVIAEGIESAAEAKALAELGCDEGQGYLFGRAMPFNEFLRHVGKQSTVPTERLSPQNGVAER